MPQTIAKAVCSQVNNDLVKITPQLDDYLCPICFTIAWRPIRMRCKHIFCVLCTIKMQKQKKKLCPLCREVVILEADAGKYSL
jgi:E3 ubiquitin-protein ligase BAH